MSGDFEGKVAVVTGAAGDLGGAAVELLLARGAEVAAVDCNRAGLEALAARLGRDGLLRLQADVRNEDEVAGYVAQALAAFGRIDLFFNNAGIEGRRTGAWRPIAELALEDFRDILAVNARGVFLGLAHVIPVMAAAGGGAIVNTSSIYGLKGSRNQVAYVASKHAVRAMTEAAAREQAGCGVRVNAIAPGAIDGRMLRDFAAIIQESSVAADLSCPVRYNPPPIERWADPKEIAEMALFLLSDEAGSITGACCSVDGGLIAL
ncbi:MAG: SDR family NAD(P)-dependent oxidoreductase [Caulobacteraceae bacterium]